MIIIISIIIQSMCFAFSLFSKYFYNVVLELEQTTISQKKNWVLKVLNFLENKSN
jgi:ABC-type multidrug transport system permease subunit